MALSCVESWWVRAALIALLCLVGVFICGRAAAELGGKDPGAVVWDEFATLPLVFLWLPPAYGHSPLALAIGLALHRVFDISKLPPVNLAERLPGGWGIMLDDMVAAVYAGGLYWILCRLNA
jgi:phosphatidylglycerophosphatase A